MSRSRSELASELAAANAEVARLSEMIVVLRAEHVLDEARLQELSREWSVAAHRCSELRVLLREAEDEDTDET